ncbi:hypothetical protein O6H91_21G026700 [Diphasiastrum complanatum]|uniref:Uncharacterized protein n=2 Tax=Diphasiastrum complanatum TaxID=34168 RepID=A0ACC2AIU4_DIPCM|nr:hypothetical protein O6H91_21G019200 [Diphasiastrum complanatum]KAJ7517499.1 hypothetical protein O6H91_21G026700 [Diphasiastrum complanatum]
MQMSGSSLDAVAMNTPSYGDGSPEGGLSFSTSPNLDQVGQELEPNSGTPAKRPLSVLLDSPDDTGDGEVADDSPLYHTEKKRRLSAEQVRSLEMSFEIDNKLEPERKLQLASELGLQPRQVAIWFQNRRARWKTKQLERDYDILKAAYDSLLSEKEKLQAEIVSLNVKLQTSSKEIGQGIKRNDADEQSNTDLAWKPASSLYLSETFMLKQPTESQVQQLHSPVSSNDASSDSTGGSPLISSPEQRAQDLNACSSCPIEEDDFQEESYSVPFFTLDEHGGWPWYWDC